MLLSKLLGQRFKETPKNADLVSHQILIKGGYVRQLSNGIYSKLTPAKLAINNIENIIRKYMEELGAYEVSFPLVSPKELWEESGRYKSVGEELVRFKDRTDKEYVLSMTHEESAVHLARTEAKSYLKYPVAFYQIQTKFRDEPRPRGGLIRLREFTMKDAYSFHTVESDLDEFYNKCLNIYHKIFKNCGLYDVVSIGSDTGMMGGSAAHEFMLINKNGEDSIVLCQNCGYKANLEIATAKTQTVNQTDAKIEKVYTKDIKTIKELCGYLNIKPSQTIKTVVVQGKNSKDVILVFMRGDYDLNESKLRNLIKEEIRPFKDYESVDLEFGFIGPCGLGNNKKFRLIFDDSLKGCKNMVAGANLKDYHYSGISVQRDIEPTEFADVKKVRDGDVCPQCGGMLSIKKGIEIGNIFKLGTKYTKSMNMTYTDKNGAENYPLMGCYGIGIDRLLASIVEQNHDQNGPIWPISVAPFKIHICPLSNKKVDVLPYAFELYDNLKAKYEVIIDDTDSSAGVKFADADLLGAPIRIIIGSKNFANGQVEIKTRDNSLNFTVCFKEVENKVDELASELENKLK